MKCLYISYDGATEPLAQSQIIPYLKRLSREKEISFILLTFDKTGFSKGNDLAGKIRQDLLSNGIKWISLRYHKRPSILATALDILLGVIVGFYIIEKYKVDVIHARSYVAALTSWVLKRLCNIKFIFDMRGFWADERVEAGLWPPNGMLFKITKFFERKFLLSANTIVSLTNAAKKEIEGFWYMKHKTTPVDVIPTCVDTDLFRIMDGPKGHQTIKPELRDEFMFVYVGSVSTWYMLEEMLDFFMHSLIFIPNAHFLFITYESQIVQGQILKKKINPVFFTIISVEHAMVPIYLSLAKAGLAFYKPGYSRKACCPTKLGEYLACGVPVIVNSDIGDSEEIIKAEKVGITFNEFNEKEYNRIIHKLKELLAEGAELKSRCRMTAQKYFSLKNGVEKYGFIYRQLKTEDWLGDHNNHSL